MSYNEQLFFQIYNLHNTMPWLNKLGIFFAQYSGYVLCLVLVFILIRKTVPYARSMFVEGFFSAIVARFVVVTVMRMLYYNPRPFDAGIGVRNLIPEEGTSFPSGHASFFFALSTVIFLYNRKLGYAFYVVSTVMGIARIFTGVHWPLDILGGAAVGIVVSLTIHPITRRWLPRFMKG